MKTTNTGKQQNKRTIAPLLAAVLMLALVAAPLCRAQAKSQDLEGMLPTNTAAYIRGTNLRAFWRELANSPLRDKLENAPIPEVRQKFLEAQNNLAAVEAMLGADLGSLIGAFLGNDFVLALFADGNGVFITRSANGNELMSAVETIVGLEQQLGKVLKEEVENYHQVEIVSMDLIAPMKPGKPAKLRHHARIGDVLVLSESLDVVKQTIDTMQGRTQSLLSTPEYREAKELMRTDAIGRAYVNTARMAESGIMEKLGNGNLRNPLFKTWHTRLKNNLEQSRFIVVNVMGNAARLEIRSSFAYDESRTPASFKALMPDRNVKLDIAMYRPDNAVASFCNSVNKVALWQFAMQTLRELKPDVAEKVREAAQHLGRSFAAMEFETEFLPQLGDQLALFVTPGAGNAPPALTAVIQLTDSEALPQCLQTQAGSLAFVNWAESKKKNKAPDFTLVRENDGAVEYTRVNIHSGPAAGKITPTMCVLGDCMILSTSAEAARAAVAAYTAPQPKVRAADAGAVFTRGHLDMKALAELARKHNEFLVREAVKKGTPEQKARTDWRNVQYLLSFFETIEMQASYTPGRIDRTVLVGLAADRSPQAAARRKALTVATPQE